MVGDGQLVVVWLKVPGPSEEGQSSQYEASSWKWSHG